MVEYWVIKGGEKKKRIIPIFQLWSKAQFNGRVEGTESITES
jgi:hypothetical protein